MQDEKKPRITEAKATSFSINGVDINSDSLMNLPKDGTVVFTSYFKPVSYNGLPIDIIYKVLKRGKFQVMQDLTKAKVDSKYPKNAKGEVCHQHIGKNQVPMGKLHPIKGKHTKQSTLEAHNRSLLWQGGLKWYSIHCGIL